MTSLCKAKPLFFLCYTLFVAVVGCDHNSNDGPNDVSSEPKDSGFVKPIHDYERRNLFKDELAAEEMPLEKGILSSSQGREHMHSTENQSAHWLYEGEYFVLDARHGLFGVEAPHEMTMMVLVNFEPQPFRLIPVTSPEGYPSIEQIQASEEPYNETAEYQLVPGKHFNYTLVLPPDAFSDGSAHDLRIVHLREFEPSNTERIRIDPFGKSRAMTVYYGGNEFAQELSDSPDLVQVAPPNDTVRELLYSLRGVVLTPPIEVYDLDEVEHPSEAQFAQVFEAPGETMELTAFAAGSDLPHEGGRNFYMLFNGSTPLVEQAKLITTEALPNDPNFEGELISKFTFEVPLLDDHVHSVVLMQFPEPYLKLDEYTHSIGSSVRSQVLFIQRASSTAN